MYKVAAQRRVIAIVDFPSADDLDRLFMTKLPLREYLELEVVWPLRQFEDFVTDCIWRSRSAAEDHADGGAGEAVIDAKRPSRAGGRSAK
jgi:hypothetical protein